MMLGGAVSLGGGMSAGPLAAQQPAGDGSRKTVWDGVYTETQAVRGQSVYQTRCRTCHQDGPPRDEAFVRNWSGTDVESLFRRIKTSMPPGAPSSLSDAEYLDIVAYILRVNAFPSGGDELRADLVKTIWIEGKNGPEPVPNFALVSMVGCLTQGPDGAWMLTSGSEPIRTRNPAASKDDELKASEGVALGTHTIQLLNAYPRPDGYKGHRIEAKGFLIRNPGGDRINATSVQTLAPQCAPGP
jgi:mono/diheme cytochrome c family protein